MRRREFILVLGAALALPSTSRAQLQKKVFRIGYLSAPTKESVQRALDVLLRKLRELGWVAAVSVNRPYIRVLTVALRVATSPLGKDDL